MPECDVVVVSLHSCLCHVLNNNIGNQNLSFNEAVIAFEKCWEHCGSITHQYVSISLRGLSTLYCCILPFVATCSRMLNLNKKLPQYFHKKCNVALTGQIHRMIGIICWLNRMLESTGNCFTGMTVRLLTSSGRGCANVSVDVSWYK